MMCPFQAPRRKATEQKQELERVERIMRFNHSGSQRNRRTVRCRFHGHTEAQKAPTDLFSFVIFCFFYGLLLRGILGDVNQLNSANPKPSNTVSKNSLY
jgi:hypothetical protein